MQSIDILYCIEHVARELDIACIVKDQAQRRYGLQVAIASLAYDTQYASRSFRPRVVAVPYFYFANVWGVGQLLRELPGANFVNLAFEQLVSKENKRFKCPRDTIVRRHVTHLAAGEFYRKFLCAHGVFPENVAIAGSLTCQLYRPPYRSYFENKRNSFARRYGLDSGKPWVFFPENYGAAFFTERDKQDRVRLGSRRDDVDTYCNFSRDSFQTVMPWCVDAARSGDIELIIRPRPATSQEQFVSAFREATGQAAPLHLHFIRQDTVREWILASDLIVSSYSTSLVEAAIAGKPAFMASPYAIPDCVRVDWNDLAPQLVSRDQFVARLADVSGAPQPHELSAWAHENLLPCGDAISNTVDLLAAICLGDVARFQPPTPAPMGKSTPYTRARKRIRHLRHHVKRATHRLLRSTAADERLHSDDRLSQDEIETLTSNWSRHLQPGQAA